MPSWGGVRRRADTLLLLLLLAGTALFPKHDKGIYALGAVSGAVYALLAAAVILVYRSNKVINFATVAVGTVGAYLTSALLTFDWLTRKVQSVCNCWQPPPHWWRGRPIVSGEEFQGFTGPNVGFWVALVIGILTSVLLSYLLYAFAVRFLSDAPRLVVALATLFFVFVCSFLIGEITPQRLASKEQLDAQLHVLPAFPPFQWHWKIGLITLQTANILVLIAVAIVVPLLAWYLVKSSAGVAIRGAADNPSRVSTLGVNVLSVTGRVWLLAGLLSGVAGMLLALGGTLPSDPDNVLEPAVLVRILTIVVFARFTSIGLAGLAALVLGILSAATEFAFSTTAPLDAALLAIIGAALLLQRNAQVRADADVESGLRNSREIRPIPAELRSLPEVRKWIRTLGIVTTVVLVGAPFVLSSSQTNQASYCLLAVMVFLSVLVLTGWAGQISLGQMAFAGVGAWTVGVTDLPFLIALVAGALAGGLLALATGVPGLRLRGLHLAIITLALSLSVTSYLLNPKYLGKHLRQTIARPETFGMDLDNEQLFFYLVVGFLALTVAMVAGLRRSAFARALIAARDNESAAQAFGINLLRARLGAYAVSGAIAGLAGALIAYQQHSVIVLTFSAGQSLRIFLFSTLGGLGAIAAPLIAGAVFTVSQLFVSAQYFRVGLGFGGILILLFASGGLADVIFGIRDNLLRGLARRRKILVPSLLSDERDTGEQRARLSIKPISRGRGGATVFIPPRYRLDDQYAIRPPVNAGTGEQR
jgi:branched-chain amino acid transport system permease protein